MDATAWTGAYERFLDDPGPWTYLVDWARTQRCLPVHTSWSHAYGVTEDGAIWVWQHEDLGPTDEALAFAKTPCPVTSGRFLCTAIIQGSLRYPWLSALRPTPPDDAVTCGVCEGLGTLHPPLVCRCGGAGWVAPDEVWNPAV